MGRLKVESHAGNCHFLQAKSFRQRRGVLWLWYTAWKYSASVFH